MNGYEKLEMEVAFESLTQMVIPIAKLQADYYKTMLKEDFTEEQALNASNNFVKTALGKS